MKTVSQKGCHIYCYDDCGNVV